MFYESHKNFSASSWLDTVAGSMHNDFLDYWEQQNIREESELSAEERATIGLFISLGQALRPLVHSLAISPKALSVIEAVFRDLGGSTELTRGKAVSFARALSAHPAVDHAIQIELAGEAAGTLLSGAEQRFASLLDLVADRTLNERSSAYLDRATRLYLWGFEPETVVMAAAAVEASYESRFLDLEMFQLQIKKEGKRFEVWQYEQAAKTKKVYSTEDQVAARELREARNDVVHNVPAVALTPIAALRAAATLLNKLFPPTSPS